MCGQGSCGYGILDKSKWPYWSVGALSTSNIYYGQGPVRGCGCAPKPSLNASQCTCCQCPTAPCCGASQHSVLGSLHCRTASNDGIYLISYIKLSLYVAYFSVLPVIAVTYNEHGLHQYNALAAALIFIRCPHIGSLSCVDNSHVCITSIQYDHA